jgi:hypothetical protein
VGCLRSTPSIALWDEKLLTAKIAKNAAKFAKEHQAD